jgi:hypothetical protein
MNVKSRVSVNPDRIRLAREQAELLLNHLQLENPDLDFLRSHAMTLLQFVDEEGERETV